jgi:hypothetical protein
VGWEGLPSQEGAVTHGRGKEQDSAHASACCITGTQGGRVSGDDLSNTGGVSSKFCGQPAEVIQKIMDLPTEAKAARVFKW